MKSLYVIALASGLAALSAFIAGGFFTLQAQPFSALLLFGVGEAWLYIGIAATLILAANWMARFWRAIRGR